MLLVFKVDTGTNFYFDVGLAAGNIGNLQQELQSSYKFPTEDQILIGTGGISLQPDDAVCKYSTVDEASPIYLLSKRDIENADPPQVTINNIDLSSADFTERYQQALDLPACYNTIVERTRLAKSFQDVAEKLYKTCESLVRDQHFQQLGWMAVVANIKDTEKCHNLRLQEFKNKFNIYLTKRESIMKEIESFPHDIEQLKELPVLAPLVEAVEQMGVLLKSSPSSSGNSTIEDFNKIRTLYDFLVNAVDGESSVFEIYEFCCRVLTEKTEDYIAQLCNESEGFYNFSNTEDMIEFKGISERLSALDELLHKAKGLAEQQKQLTMSFMQNQNSASGLQDSSVLQNLCLSHREQLKIMKKTHDELLEFRHRCGKSKVELGEKIHYCLKWISYMQNGASNADLRFVDCETDIKEMERRLTIFHQIHSAPEVYLSCISEVVRRRAFSEAFLASASHLACSFLSIYNDEVGYRKEFLTKVRDSFLKYLFPGIKSMPEAYGIRPPTPFDKDLPMLIKEDIEQLKENLPKFQDKIITPDIESIHKLFYQFKSYKTDSTELSEMEEKIGQVVQEVCSQSNFRKPEGDVLSAAVIKDLDRGCESETDTEEFEKVGHVDKETVLPVSRVQDASTLTEVGDRNCIPPKKPPRIFHKPQLTYPITEVNHIVRNVNLPPQRAMSFSGSNTESFTNIKNSSLESINELSSLKNFSSNTDSCFNSHHQQMHCFVSHSKSLSPHTPQSPKDLQGDLFSPTSPIQGHQLNEFVNDEFYIDESLPSSLSIETGQSQGEFVRQLDTANNVVALLQDTIQTLQKENMYLKSCLANMAQMISGDYNIMKKDMSDMRLLVSTSKQTFKLHCDNLVENVHQEIILKERDISARLKSDYVTRIEEYKDKISSYENRIECLESENSCLESSLSKSVGKVQDLELQLEALKKEQEEERVNFEKKIDELRFQNKETIEEITNRLNLDHKAEKEAMKMRFHLMTAAKETPCEGSERLETVELKKHEAIVSQVIENCEIEKGEAIKKAVEEVLLKSGHWAQEPDDLQKFAASSSSDGSDRRESTKRELKLLKKEAKEYCLSNDMGASVSTFTAKERLSKSSINKHIEKASNLSISKNYSRICYFSCHPGDLVVVLWDLKYNNYRIAQDESHLYFLHSDSAASLGLDNQDKTPKSFILGEVIDKEYCFAKKVENRYHVPVKTKFFRVQVKPISKKTRSIMSQSDILSRTYITSNCSSVPTTPSRQSPNETDTTQTTLIDTTR